MTSIFRYLSSLLESTRDKVKPAVKSFSKYLLLSERETQRHIILTVLVTWFCSAGSWIIKALASLFWLFLKKLWLIIFAFLLSDCALDRIEHPDPKPLPEYHREFDERRHLARNLIRPLDSISYGGCRFQLLDSMNVFGPTYEAGMQISTPSECAKVISGSAVLRTPVQDTVFSSRQDLVGTFPVSLVTNGTHLAQWVDELAVLAPGRISVSLDAAEAEAHDRQRRKARRLRLDG